MIPFLDVKAGYDELQEELDGAISRVARSGRYIGGPEVDSFEEEFAAYLGVRHCIGVGNGLDALRLALLALGVGPGDEVIVPSNTFIATWLAVSQTGAKPVPVEPDVRTHNVDAELMEDAITAQTKVIIPVHLYGQPADMHAVGELAERHGLAVLEDAAQAHGARYHGKRVGGIGTMAAWSFYPGKNLGVMGDAGAVTTNDDQLAAKLRLLGNYGSPVKYVHEVQGINSRLDAIQAAVLRVKLRKLDSWNLRRQGLANFYAQNLSGSDLDLPGVLEGVEPVWHLFVIQTDRRNDIQTSLANAGVETLIHYPVPPHLQSAYAELGMGEGSLPRSERLADRILSLPMGPHVSESNAEQIVEAVREAAT